MINNTYTPITELTEGQEFRGYNQYFQVLHLNESIYYPSGKCVTIFVWAGDCHRVEFGDYNDILDRLNAALDHTSNHDAYWEEEHPEIVLAAAWPDDCDFDQIRECYAPNSKGEPIIKDIYTGENYDWLP